MAWFLRYLREHHLALVALFIALGGTSYAAVKGIPGRDGVVHGCFKSKGGALRVVRAGSRCKHGERALSWNQKGQAGPQGLQGPPGLAGAQGDPGPSDVYADGADLVQLTSSFAAYGTVTLPAGSYALQGKVMLEVSGSPGDNATVLCELANPGGANPQDSAQVGPLQPGQSDTLALDGVMTISSTQQMALLCQRTGTGPASVGIIDSRVIATKTASLHGTVPVD